jgi:hypothetical protein
MADDKKYETALAEGNRHLRPIETATYCGFGPMPNAQVHHAALVILAAATAHVMSVADMASRIHRRI